MDHPPFPADGKIMDRAMLTDIGVVAIIMAVGTLSVFFTSGESIVFRRTMAFTTLILFQLFNTLQARSSSQSAFIGMFRNGWLWVVLGATLLVQVIVLDLPWIARAFGVAPLTILNWIECAFVASSVIWGMEIVKWVRRYSQTRRNEAYAA